MIPGTRGVLTAAAAALVLLPGCAQTADRSLNAAPAAPSSTATGALPEPPLFSPLTTPSVPADCPARDAALLGDGLWDGPLTLRVASIGGVPVTRSVGSGRLQALVLDGQVVQGAWTLTWRTTGRGPTDGGQVTVRLVAEVAGTVSGPATEPVAHGAWAVSGAVRFTQPVTATLPVAGKGQAQAPMTVRARGCDTASATFPVKVKEKGARTRLAGTVHWTGRRGASG
jgi:hypothetical protein